uniref:Dehydrogenase n=1 Tax=Geobacter metallireducens TaxID=28232 RepID=A0A831UB26_GEOME
MNGLDVIREFVRLADAGVPAALATVVETTGSSPRKAGARMVVGLDGTTVGTVGGGKIELETVAAAREAIRDGRPRSLPFTLTEEQGHVCGGRVLVYIEPAAAPPRLVIAGGGHVGEALARAASFAGFRVTVADDRPAYAKPGRFSGAGEVLLCDYGTLFGQVPVDDATLIVIATSGFEQDFAAVRGALGTPAPYIGLVGSARKREVLRATLAAEGYGARQIDRVTIPAGLPIGGETPEEIAVSIAAQLIEQRHRKPPSPPPANEAPP